MNAKKIKQLIFNFSPSLIRRLYQEPLINEMNLEKCFYQKSYSQEGEDIILKRIFDGIENGFYIDVGAHHPRRFSNTYLFYDMGWHGINIDATPGSMQIFKELRPNDINLELGISNTERKLTYHIFNEPALNTFSKIEAKKKDGLRDFKIIDKVELQTFRLTDILQQYLKKGQHIDFLNIDVEGLDFQVLKSLDWKIYKPTVILIESLDLRITDIKMNEIFLFLENKSYWLIAKTFNTLIFKRL